MKKGMDDFRQPLSYCAFAGKPGYDKKGAVTAKNHRYKHDHVELRIYPCKNHWHFTSQRQHKADGWR